MIGSCAACSLLRRVAAVAACSIVPRIARNSTRLLLCDYCCALTLPACISLSIKPVVGTRMLWLCILLPPLEPAALSNLALWALQWSSQVSSCMPARSCGPATLWLEIGASQQLFGSAEALRAGIAAELATLGYRASLGVAPTPQGAALLARADNSGATSHTDADAAQG